MNFLIFGIMIFCYAFLKIYSLSAYCLFSSICFSIICILRKKIPEIISIIFLLVNLVVYSVFFSFVAKFSAGAELYPMVLPVVCYLLTYELKKPKWLCPCFSIFSGLACLSIIIFFGWNTEKVLPFSRSFYTIHETIISCVVISGLTLLSVTYEAVLIKKNINEKKQKEELIYIANHDPLTGLNNRRRLWEYLHFCENQKKEMGTNYVISIFDIDNFKRVNDKYGHSCGDFILVEISRLIKENLGQNVKIGRWGGEEFLLLYKAYSDEKAIEEIEKLRKLIDDTQFDFLGTQIHITLTFGVSSSSYCDTAEQIIIDADKQLMKGKIQGKNRVVARSLQNISSVQRPDKGLSAIRPNVIKISANL